MHSSLDQVWCPTATNQSIHGRSDCDHISPRQQVDPPRSRKQIISWVLVLKRGKVVDKFQFTNARITIPSFTEQQVNSLGKIFDCSLEDVRSIRRTRKKRGAWLTKVDKLGLPGRFKAWIYQHYVLA